MDILVKSLMVYGKAGDKDMNEFRNCFNTFAKRTCDPALWKPYFSDARLAEWEEEESGHLEYEDSGGRRHGLLILYWSGLGFLLELSCWNQQTHRSEWCKFSVSDRTRLAQFEERDDLHYPVGCFLSPAHAWLAVEDFLSQPTQPSSRIGWIDDADVSWPE